MRRSRDLERAVDRLLDGQGDVADAPPEIAPAISVLRAAAGPREQMVGVNEAPARIAALVRAGAPSHPRIAGLADRVGWRLRVGAGLVAGALAGTTGLAMADVLPASIQHAAHTALVRVGLHVPDSAGGGHGNGHGTVTPDTLGSHPGNPVGPDLTGPAAKGLCQAAFEGQGTAKDNASKAVAFARLQEAAKAANKTPEQFCAGITQPAATAGGTTTTLKGGPPSGQPGNGHEGGGKGHPAGTAPTTTSTTVADGHGNPHGSPPGAGTGGAPANPGGTHPSTPGP